MGPKKPFPRLLAVYTHVLDLKSRKDGDVECSIVFRVIGNAGFSDVISQDLASAILFHGRSSEIGEFYASSGEYSADDLLDRDLQGGRSLRRVDAPGFNQSRALRSVNGAAADPARDLVTDYDWTLVVNPINDSPNITSPARDPNGVARIATINELEMFDVTMEASDVDNAGNELVWSVLNQDDLPGAAGDAWTFTDNGNGTARFTWTTTYDDGRDDPYLPQFRVADPAGAGDIITLELRVRDLNRPPVIDPDAPGLVTIVEDGDNQLIADIADIFSDPDLEDAVLTINIDPSPVNLVLHRDGTLLLSSPTGNYNTYPDPPFRRPHASVGITATDRDHEQVVWRFLVAVTPVNDRPADFNLVSPAPDYVAEDWWNTPLNFAWETAAQVINELDTVSYTVRFTFRQEEYSIGPLRAIEYRNVPLWAIADSLGIPVNDTSRIVVSWSVDARDSEFLVTARNSPRTLILDQLSVREGSGSIPTAYFLEPNFPNPFNSGTTIKFGLPNPTNVEVTVWDMHGRQVALLTRGKLSPGRYETVWDASGQASGIYIIRMNAGDFRALQKAILMR